MPQPILVTGAAGSVGSTARTAITILLEQGHRVRAMVRKLDARADMLRDLGAEVVVGRHARHCLRARGHARLLSGVFHDLGFAQLPGSGRQRRGHGQKPGCEGLRQFVADDAVADERDRDPAPDDWKLPRHAVRHTVYSNVSPCLDDPGHVAPRRIAPCAADGDRLSERQLSRDGDRPMAARAERPRKTDCDPSHGLQPMRR
jgi:hypothetical protein